MKRLFYIDNLRIFLISLVVLHHLAITYGAPGSWYYNESEVGFPEIFPMAMFITANQAFFMGMFFFVSAFFLLPSLNRKGIGKFIKDRLLRLGIPLLFFYFLLSPLTVFIKLRYIQGEAITFAEILKNKWGFGFGPMWFVEALLVFTAFFLVFKALKVKKMSIPFPGTKKIILFALLVGILQFLIRIRLPIGWEMPFTSFQIPFFLQYILLFALGVIAYQNNWMASITENFGWKWFVFVQLLIFVAFPILFVYGGALDGNIDKFVGGITWQCFSYAIWEQLVGFGMILALTGIFKKYFNRQRGMAKSLSASAYGVFIFHPPLLVGLSAVFVNWQINPLLKFIILAPLALFVCFVTAYLIKKIPLCRKIL